MIKVLNKERVGAIFRRLFTSTVCLDFFLGMFQLPIPSVKNPLLPLLPALPEEQGKRTYNRNLCPYLLRITIFATFRLRRIRALQHHVEVSHDFLKRDGYTPTAMDSSPSSSVRLQWSTGDCTVDSYTKPSVRRRNVEKGCAVERLYSK